MTQTFFVPGPLPGANDIVRKHWRVYTNLKKQWGAVVGYALMAAKVKPITAAHISFEWHEPVQRRKQRRDPDNIIFAQKFVMDSLVNCGILPDDSMDEVLSLTHTWKQVKLSRQGGVQVTLASEESACVEGAIRI